MTPYRQETAGAGAQSVRFYKFVAITFLLATLVLLGIIIFSSTKKAVIIITTKTEPVDVNFSVGVNQKDLSNNLVGTVASTTVNLTKIYKPTGQHQVAGSASGKMVLHNDGDVPQTLIATTRLLTSEGVIFRIKDKVSIPAQDKTEVYVYADTNNTVSSTGVGKLTVPGLSLDKQKIIYATNDQPIGGTRMVGMVSNDDIKKSGEDLKAELEKAGEKALAVQYPQMSGAYTLVQYLTQSKENVGAEVENFTVSGSATVVGVFFKQAEIDSMAKNELNKQIVTDAEILKAGNNVVNVTVGEYDLAKNTAKLAVSLNGSVELNPDSKQLAKENFYGKNEQEVRRYLLSLDHIKDVNIDFSPAWVSTIPSIPEHVSIVVKKVE